MSYVPDNYDIWEAYDRKQQEVIEKLPGCDYCDNVILDDYYYEINGDKVCETCLNEYFRKAVEVDEYADDM
jgi:formylmethanofuran dehydrogenase subunit E